MLLQHQVSLNVQMGQHIISPREALETRMCVSMPAAPRHTVLPSGRPRGHFACWSHISLCRKAKLFFSLVIVVSGVLLDGLHLACTNACIQPGHPVRFPRTVSAPGTNRKTFYSVVKSWTCDGKLMQRVLGNWTRACGIGPRPTWGSCFKFYLPRVLRILFMQATWRSVGRDKNFFIPSCFLPSSCSRCIRRKGQGDVAD